MVEVGIAEYFGIGAAIGIIGTMFVVLYFSRKHMQRLTVDVKTKVLMTWMKRFAKWQKL
jgi:hypothetical protein